LLAIIMRMYSFSPGCLEKGLVVYLIEPVWDFALLY
jgi:hypothetical protein